jgi:hypothetical protein
MKLQKTKALLLSLVSTFSTTSVISLSVINSSAMAGNTILCPSDRPCINHAYQDGNKVIFGFNHTSGWDYYNVRYGVKQVENRSGSFTITNVQPNRIYRISVQGCSKHFLSRSTCSSWVSESVTTR